MESRIIRVWGIIFTHYQRQSTLEDFSKWQQESRAVTSLRKHRAEHHLPIQDMGQEAHLANEALGTLLKIKILTSTFEPSLWFNFSNIYLSFVGKPMCVGLTSDLITDLDRSAEVAYGQIKMLTVWLVYRECLPHPFLHVTARGHTLSFPTDLWQHVNVISCNSRINVLRDHQRQSRSTGAS